MQLTIFGASGGIGSACARQALAAGHTVHAPVRASSIGRVPAGATAIVTDVLDAASVTQAVAGSAAIISCLGMRRRHPRNPWSTLLGPHDLTSRSAANIALAAATHGIERGAVVSAAGVGGSPTNVLMRLLIANSSLGPAYVDLARMEAVYAAHAPTFVVVRPTTLTNGRPRPARVVHRYGVFSRIPRAAVAQCLLDIVSAESPPPGLHLAMLSA